MKKEAIMGSSSATVMEFLLCWAWFCPAVLIFFVLRFHFVVPAVLCRCVYTATGFYQENGVKVMWIRQTSVLG